MSGRKFCTFERYGNSKAPLRTRQAICGHGREVSIDSRLVDDPTVQSEIETIKSERVAAAVVKRLNLTNDPEFVGASLSLLRRAFRFLTFHSGTEPPQEQMTRRALDGVTGAVKVSRVGRSFVVDVSFTSQDPPKSAKITNTIADA